jgi:hypothetical protein
MIEDRAPGRRRRLGAQGMMFRGRRIFARLREGFPMRKSPTRKA